MTWDIEMMVLWRDECGIGYKCEVRAQSDRHHYRRKGMDFAWEVLAVDAGYSRCLLEFTDSFSFH